MDGEVARCLQGIWLCASVCVFSAFWAAKLHMIYLPSLLLLRFLFSYVALSRTHYHPLCPPSPYIYIPWYCLYLRAVLAPVVNYTVTLAAHYVSSTTRAHTLFVFVVVWRSPQLAFLLDHLYGVDNLYCNKGTRGMIGSPSVYGKTPMRQSHSNPIAVSGSGLT